MCLNLRPQKEDMLLVGWGPAGRISPSPPSHGTAMRIDCIASIPFRPHTGGFIPSSKLQQTSLATRHPAGDSKTQKQIDITICGNILMFARQRFIKMPAAVSPLLMLISKKRTHNRLSSSCTRYQTISLLD